MATRFEHQPVLLEQALSYLNLRPDGTILDGTLGGGGHAAAILERIGAGGSLVGLDLDNDALRAAADRLSPLASRVRLLHSSFRDLRSALDQLGIARVDGILLDLGVSSYQIDARERGFRFGGEDPGTTPLDMRMNRDEGRTAADLLRTASREELQTWLSEYGELPGSARLARAIVRERRESAIESAADLLAVIRSSGVGRGRRHNPATLVFQALRIAVNDELAALREGLEAACQALAPGGRLVVLAYHSLEDRIVKHALRAAERGCVCPSDFPVCVCQRAPSLRVLTRRPVRPDDAEVEANPRARSARLRAAERLPYPATETPPGKGPR